jgi:serine/threonine protein phosphatase PrpC
MQYRTLGKTGLKVSEVGMGTWQLAGNPWGWDKPDEAESLKALAKFVDLGGNFIDTAWVYGRVDDPADLAGGHCSEELIGNFMKAAKNRDQLIIASKIPGLNRKWPARLGVPISEVFPKGYIEKMVDSSLKSLQIDTIDLMQFHVWQDQFVEEEEIYKHVGCTACIALISGDEFIVANTGDSRCVLCVDGAAVEMSVDHKPENEEEKKRIEQAKGFVEECRVNGNLNLSRSLGDHEYKQDKSIPPEEQLITYVPDVKVHKITPKTEFAVIACDGIWEVWDSSKVIEFVRKRITSSAGLAGIIDELFEALISPDAVCNQFGCDNMTCIIIQFKSS